MRLRHSPVFTATVVLTLGSGIGAVVAMFSLYSRIVLNPVTARQPETLMAISRASPANALVVPTLSWPRVQAIRRTAKAFAQVAAYSNETVSLASTSGLPHELRGLRVSAEFFEAVGVFAARGRLLDDADDAPNGPAVCVLSYEAWQTQFGGGNVVGTKIRLDGRSTEVVGVLPPRFSLPWADRDIFLPRVFDDSQSTPQAVAGGASYLSVIARLGPGATTARAAEELREISRGFAAQLPGRSDTLGDLVLTPLADTVSGARRSFWSALVCSSPPWSAFNNHPWGSTALEWRQDSSPCRRTSIPRWTSRAPFSSASWSG